MHFFPRLASKCIVANAGEEVFLTRLTRAWFLGHRTLRGTLRRHEATVEGVWSGTVSSPHSQTRRSLKLILFLPRL